MIARSPGHSSTVSPSALDNISVVLVDTKTPANIGSVARAMMNMGLTRLVLVNPPNDRRGEAYTLAAGARHIIDSALVHHTLRGAVSNQELVVGVSRRRNPRRGIVHTPRELAEQIVSLARQNRISLVFGNEVNGLERKDLSLCNELISIPSSDAFPSLNLSHAVMIVVYEIFLAAGIPIHSESSPLAPARELENLYRHLQHMLEAAEFINEGSAERIMYSLRRIFGRARLDPREVRILHGIVTAREKGSK